MLGPDSPVCYSNITKPIHVPTCFSVVAHLSAINVTFIGFILNWRTQAKLLIECTVHIITNFIIGPLEDPSPFSQKRDAIIHNIMKAVLETWTMLIASSETGVILAVQLHLFAFNCHRHYNFAAIVPEGIICIIYLYPHLFSRQPSYLGCYHQKTGNQKT